MIICKCDGCGKEAPASSNGKELIKPEGWLEKRNYPQFQGGPLYLHACSKECIATIEQKLWQGHFDTTTPSKKPKK